MPKNVAPRGLPTERNRAFATGGVCSAESCFDAMVVLRRNSCVTAMPMLAKDRDLRVRVSLLSLYDKWMKWRWDANVHARN